MNRIKVRLKKNGFETEYNENIARILIRRGEAELAEREVPRRGAKPAEEQEKTTGRGRKTKKNDPKPAKDEEQEPEAEETSETDEE